MKLCLIYVANLWLCVTNSNGNILEYEITGHRLVKRQSIAEMTIDASCTLVCEPPERYNPKIRVKAKSDYEDNCFYECELIPIFDTSKTQQTHATAMTYASTQITETPKQPSSTTKPLRTTNSEKLTTGTRKKEGTITTHQPSELLATTKDPTTQNSEVKTKPGSTEMEYIATSVMTTEKTATTAKLTSTSLHTTTKPLLYYYTNNIITTPNYDDY
uniref:Seven cysteines N-terminal domain-containing protein n=1 Tax=Homalodisca liturata TaxID=320908 RepID=A0A1B6JPR8_9HEMI